MILLEREGEDSMYTAQQQHSNCNQCIVTMYDTVMGPLWSLYVSPLSFTMYRSRIAGDISITPAPSCITSLLYDYCKLSVRGIGAADLRCGGGPGYDIGPESERRRLTRSPRNFCNFGPAVGGLCEYLLILYGYGTR
jgi:hypothetical protein